MIVVGTMNRVESMAPTFAHALEALRTECGSENKGNEKNG